MKALFVYSTKFERYQGKYYSVSETADVWNQRYLNNFDSLTVLGRVVDVDNVNGKVLSSTDNVEFHCTPLGVNAKDYFTKRKEIERFIANEVKNTDFVIARQSYFSAIAVKYAKKYGKPYVCEVVGSSWDSNWNYSLKGKVVAPYFELQARHMIKSAKYVVYVTQKFLQKEYPTSGQSIGISNVSINRAPKEVLEQRAERIENCDCKKLTLCTVAAVDVKYKGQAYVIESMKHLRECGYDLTYYVIGGGDQTRLRNIAAEFGLSDKVIFTGPVKHNEVFNFLDKSDVYIQPSLQEGLPRAMIEAMSRGLPAIGFKTAGIPELIDAEFVCRRKSVEDICRCLRMLDKNVIKEQSKRNQMISRDYEFDVLNARRSAFYKDAKENFNYK